MAEKVGGHRPRAQATKASIAGRRTRRRLRFARNDGDGSYSNLQTASGMRVHVLAARCVRVSRLVSPTSKRAQGKPGARCTRGLVCKVHKRKRTRAYRFSGGNPAFPARWFYGLLRALPGDRLSCHRHPRDTSRELSASIGAPGPHDFAVRDRPRSSVVALASTASHRAFVTCARPSCRVRRASW